ncbi:MAG: tRNA preQ1(34) S-adenosylmethionine ribosyltransferase-isomerase QueA [Planctomycetes bacterium]|nr:tRNA preQ1(34) S-adenosylmethionine ribosyltransferase-isomerase QueA [Planctomycetota bacterium]
MHGKSAVRPLDRSFKLSDLDYDLPESLIAQTPTARRNDARLLLLERRKNEMRDDGIPTLADQLVPGDLLVVNDTKVLPAKFAARRKSGGKIPGLFLHEESDSVWVVMLRGSRRLRVGEYLTVIPRTGDSVTFELIESLPGGQWRVRVSCEGSAEKILERIGRAPLPPYIRRASDGDDRDAEDRTRYQTIYAKHAGAVAAPTAGLHLTESLLDAIRAKGVAIASLTLHVGLGTFKPIATDSIEKHPMHSERFELSAETAEAVNSCKGRGGRVIAVGTTSVRVLETVARDTGEDARVEPKTGSTDLFVYPPYRFRVVDALLTNFHLPGSTLLALVMAFAGVDLVKQAYRHAVEREYRFYSYGDAMFVS